MASSDIRSLIDEFISQLDALIQQEVLTIAAGAFGGGPRTAVGGRRPSTAATARRRLQGRYLGTLRGLKGDARRRVQAVARKDGVPSALKLADRLRRR
jgi:hypothetical protein